MNPNTDPNSKDDAVLGTDPFKLEIENAKQHPYLEIIKDLDKYFMKIDLGSDKLESTSVTIKLSLNDENSDVPPFYGTIKIMREVEQEEKVDEQDEQEGSDAEEAEEEKKKQEEMLSEAGIDKNLLL